MPPRRRKPAVPKPAKIMVAKPPAPSPRQVSKTLNDLVTSIKAGQQRGVTASRRTPQRQRGPRRPDVPPIDTGAVQTRAGTAYSDVLMGAGAAEPEQDTPEEMRARAAEQTRYLSPTPSTMPERPRTLEASYDPAQQVLRVTFRDGGTYDYFGVPRRVWYNFARVKSPGKFIDRNVKGVYPYEKVGAG